MFFLFKHRDSRDLRKQNYDQDKIAQNIVYRCIGMQVIASKYLQNKSEMLPVKAKRWFVLAFCFISFCSCIYLIIKSIYAPPNTSLAIVAIRVPTQSTHHFIQPSISGKEFEKIQKFKAYLDSLAKSKSGKRIYDSLTANSLGLIDSLSIVENLYQSQSLNK
jgi:hypothetical protein